MKKVRVKLLKPHFHNGLEHPVGSVMEVPEDTASFLTGHGVVSILAEPSEKQPKPESK